MAGLVRGQLAEDGTYPNAGAVFGEVAEGAQSVQDYSPNQPRDPQGRWSEGGGGASAGQSKGAAGESGAVEAPRGLTVHPRSIPAASSEGTSQATPATVTTAAAQNGLCEKAESLIELFNPVTPAAQENMQNSRSASIVQTSEVVKSANPDASTHVIANYVVGVLKLARAYLAVQREVLSVLGQAANLILGAAAPPIGSPGAPGDGTSPQDVKRGFVGPKSMRQWRNQMSKRGWTAQQIEEAVQNGKSLPEPNRINPANGATRYVHPQTGRSVVIDNQREKSYMSEETASITKLIYIPLLDEGVDVVRPTQAMVQGINTFRVLPTEDYDVNVDSWAFVPGSVVECVEEQREDRRLLVARRLL